MRDSGASEDRNPSLGLVEICLRLTVVPLTVASLSLMATDRQINDDYGKLTYNNFSGFKYLFSVDAICAGYTLVAILFSCFRGSFSTSWVFYITDQVFAVWFLHVLWTLTRYSCNMELISNIFDQALAYLMLTSGAAVTDIMYLAYKGNRNVSWSEACTYYGRFCNRAKVSLALHFIALMCFIALALISAFRVFSKFEAPDVPSKDGGEQVE